MSKANYYVPAWLDRAHTVDSIVSEINLRRELYGAQCAADDASSYAIDCELRKHGNPLIKISLSARLDELLEKGAKFSKRRALKSIIEYCEWFGISLR